MRHEELQLIVSFLKLEISIIGGFMIWYILNNK